MNAISLCMLASSGAPCAWGQWQQTQKLTASDATPDDGFGISVAISGDVAVIGAWFTDGAGSAYVFRFDPCTSQWIEETKLTASDGALADLFGWSVSISGNIAIVGAFGDDHAGTYSGSAYLFDITTGEQLHKLTADDAGVEHYFGESVAIDGAIALVGRGGLSHSAYLFDVATGEQLYKFTVPVAGFGSSVSIDGGIAIIGAYSDGGVGSAYLFDVSNPQNPIELQQLTAADAAADDLFGWSVSIDGGIAIVGAIRDDDACPGDPMCDSGSAYLFDAATGRQLHKLTADAAAASDEFGRSVSISGGIALVGATGDDDAGSNSGSAYLFDVTTGQQLRKLTADDAAGSDEFGGSVSISRGIAIVGVYLDDDAGSASGSAYLFGEGEPCPADLDGDGIVGILDLLALLAAWGTDPVGPPDFDGDGTVGILDLLTLLVNWGECP